MNSGRGDQPYRYISLVDRLKFIKSHDMKRTQPKKKRSKKEENKKKQQTHKDKLKRRN